MTWGEFKQEVESSGVFDDTEIDFIDTGGVFTNNWNVIVGFNKDYSCEITVTDKNPKEN